MRTLIQTKIRYDQLASIICRRWVAEIRKIDIYFCFHTTIYRGAFDLNVNLTVESVDGDHAEESVYLVAAFVEEEFVGGGLRWD